MLTDFVDLLAQYRAMLSPAVKRRKAEQSRAILAGLLPRLGPQDTVIDCGANVGTVTGKLAETGARVIAFEPDPVAFAALSRAHGHRPNVTLHNAAVGIKAGDVTLLRDRSFHKDPLQRTVRSTTIAGGRRIAGGDAVTVPMIDLPALLRDVVTDTGQIAFLKLDVEGAELDILETMLDSGQLDDIRLTVAETHEKKFAHLRPRFRRLRRTIAARYPQSRVNLDWN